MHGEAALLNPYVVKGVFLFGLLLGVLGALFLAYDLLGSQDGPLRKFLRLAIPGLLGALTIVPVHLLAWLFMRVAVGALAPGSGFAALDHFQVLVWMPSIGAFLGVMTALYGAPAGDPATRPTFSRRDSRSGFLLALAYIVVIDGIQFARVPYNGLQARDYWAAELSSALAAALAVGVAAGLWRGASRITALDAKPGLFAPHEAVVGAGAGAGMILAPNLVGGFAVTLLMPQLRAPGIVALNLLVGPLLIALVVAAAGAVIGGLWPRVFWWAGHASKNRLELIGVLCILVGFIAQAVDPIASLLEL